MMKPRRTSSGCARKRNETLRFTSQETLQPGMHPGLEGNNLANSCLAPGLYGQRFAVSSHPAARTGCGAGMDGADGTEVRVACGPLTAVAKAGFEISVALSFSSDSKGATSRRASTSFSRRVNSISFCRNTS